MASEGEEQVQGEDPSEYFHREFHRIMRGAKYQEEFSEICISRLSTLHRSLSFTAGGTATGSPIAGLAFWEHAWGKTLWVGLTAVSALAAYLLGFSDAPDRIKREERTRQMFMQIRLRAETAFQRLGAPLELRPTLDEAKGLFAGVADDYKNALVSLEVSAFRFVLLRAKDRAERRTAHWLEEEEYS